MATMREVAAKAGVSVKTVSRVFNEDPHVLPETRERVEAVMRELEYVPNALATTFRNGRAPVIGVAVPDVVDPFFAAIIRSVDSVAEAAGMSTLVTNLGADPKGERSRLESLLQRQLSGLVIAPIGTSFSWMKPWLARTPVVFVDRSPVGLRVDRFTEDDRGGARLATDHLLDRGHVRIAFFGDLIELSTESGRLEGWREALKARGIDPDEDLVAIGSGPEKVSAELRRLAGLDSPPTAIFSSNARTSMELASALRGHPIPMVGFGDFPMAEVVVPSITVIDQDPAQLGRLAAQRVLDRLENPARRLKKTNVLDVRLVVRESSRGPGKG